MSVICLLTPGANHAVIAKPGVITYRQPTGKEINIRLHGDETHHYYTSEDNYVLISENDTLFYSAPGPDGLLKNSGYIAENIIERSTLTENFLRSIDENAALIQARTQPAGNIKQLVRSRVTGNEFGLFPGSDFPKEGRQKALVILVEFSDIEFHKDYDACDYFQRMLNATGFSDYGAQGSVADYFRENSNSLFLPEFDVYGPVKLPKISAYYGANDANGSDIRPAQMVIDACRQLDSRIDFSEYDRNNDGSIDNVFIFYAGRGEASGGLSTTIWPHSWDVNAYTETAVVLDNKTLGRYACTNEWDGKKPDGPGTFIHEFSHVLGLPDLYSTSYTDAFTPGAWSVMDAGSYNNDGRTPPCYSSFERYALGWSKPVSLKESRLMILRPVPDDSGYIIRTDNSNELIFIENRQQKGWDSFLPGHGMLAWHVVYDEKVWNDNKVNDNPDYQYVDLIEADNLMTPSSRDGDCFPGNAEVREFSSLTHPGYPFLEKISIGNIDEREGEITGVFTDVSFKNSSPVLSPAEDITDKSFTARWIPIQGASDYEFTLFKKVENGSQSASNGFDEGIKLTDGWYTSTLMTGKTENNSGQNPPSLMFLQQGGVIESPVFHDIKSINFWYKISRISVNYDFPSIMIYGKIGSEWIEMATVRPEENDSGSTCTIENISPDIEQIRIRIIGAAGYSCYIDDINISHGKNYDLIALPGYPLNTGDTDHLFVDGLESATVYAYQLTATDGVTFSHPSDLAEITTAAESALIGTPNDSVRFPRLFKTAGGIRIESTCRCDVAIFNIDGRLVAEHKGLEPNSILLIPISEKGLYIVKCDCHAVKVLF